MTCLLGLPTLPLPKYNDGQPVDEHCSTRSLPISNNNLNDIAWLISQSAFRRHLNYHTPEVDYSLSIMLCGGVAHAAQVARHLQTGLLENENQDHLHPTI